MKLFKPFILGCTLLTVLSCDPKDVIPSYLYVKKFSLVTNTDQGSNSINVPIGYIYVDDEYIGAFQLPATVPVLKYGIQKVTIIPAVYENGISNTPIVNRFYEKYNVEIDLKETQIDTISPKTTYVKKTIFEVVDNFEGATSLQKDLDNDNQTYISFVRAGFEGSSGYVFLEGEHKTMQASTVQNFTAIPSDAEAQFFIELDFKCTSIIRMGLQGLNAKGDSTLFFTNALNPTENWKKVYLNIANPLIDSDTKSYHIFFETTIPEGKNNAEIWLDNFKFMHF